MVLSGRVLSPAATMPSRCELVVPRSLASDWPQPIESLAVGGVAVLSRCATSGPPRSTVGSDTYQITVEDDIALTAPRKTSRDINRHKASNYQPG